MSDWDYKECKNIIHLGDTLLWFLSKLLRENLLNLYLTFKFNNKRYRGLYSKKEFLGLNGCKEHIDKYPTYLSFLELLKET